jgi:class 3 adenylate cyclase
LTIYFSDIKDFTSTTEDMEPEDLTYLLNKYFSEMSKIAHEHGATIDKFVGDAMLCFFGDPQTRGVREDALQCVRMAVAMQRRYGRSAGAVAREGLRQAVPHARRHQHRLLQRRQLRQRPCGWTTRSSARR